MPVADRPITRRAKRRPQPRGWSEMVRNESDERAVANGCVFSWEHADRFVEFCRRFLRLSDGAKAGQPFELLPWQRDDIAIPVFGWRDAEGLRRFRRTYIEVPIQNGKSQFGSAVGLYLLMADGEIGAQVYSAAYTRDQAGVCHGEAIKMVDASPELSSILKVNRSTHDIKYEATNGVYRALPNEAGAVHGKRAHGLIIDELHAWKGRDFWDALLARTASRRQPLTFVITTASDSMTGVCRQQHEYAKAVLSGEVNDQTFFGKIYAADEADDWTSPETWRKANPSLGTVLRESEMATSCAEAQLSPASEAAFKRYRLNLWGMAIDRWIEPERWDGCRRPFSESDLVGKPCFGGFDLGITRDMTALVLAFPWADDTVRVLPFFWLPEKAAQGEQAIRLRGWAAAGHLKLTPGDWVDQAVILEDMVSIARRFDVRTLAYDPSRADLLIQSLQTRCDRLHVEPFGQGFQQYTAGTEAWENRVLAGTLHQNGHPILRDHVTNAVVIPKMDGSRKPVKRDKDSPNKVDGAQAGVMALAKLLRVDRPKAVGMRFLDWRP